MTDLLTDDRWRQELEWLRREPYAAIHQPNAIAIVEELLDLRARVKELEAALERWRKELCALCEDTEEHCAEAATDLEGKEGAYARGRIREAKSIRKAMGEVIYEDFIGLKDAPR